MGNRDYKELMRRVNEPLTKMKAPTLPTAEETLQIAYDTIKANQSPEHKDVDPVLLHAIESHTSAHTAALRQSVEELQSQLAKYREALENISNTYSGSPDTDGLIEIADEALKQEGEA